MDVSTKAEIYALTRELATDGFAILITSSNLPDVLAISDRTLVMSEGRMAGELSHTEATERQVMVCCIETGRYGMIQSAGPFATAFDAMRCFRCAGGGTAS